MEAGKAQGSQVSCAQVVGAKRALMPVHSPRGDVGRGGASTASAARLDGSPWRPPVEPPQPLVPTCPFDGGASGPPESAAQHTYRSCLVQLREQQFVPFMQFHMQQGMLEHAARAAWDMYEQRRMSELCGAPT